MSKIASQINNIQSDHYDQLNGDTRDFLQSFYLQVIHQPVKFTAMGFYTISLGLLASILTGIVSYQIILVQFYST